MDYFGWELERQRRALAALLLGSGAANERETAPEKTRQRRAEASNGKATAKARSAGEAERSGPEAPGAWETVREARRGQDAEPKTPVSAWEGVLGLWGGGEDGQERRSVGAGVPVGLDRGGQPLEEDSPGGGTGAWEAATEGSGQREALSAEGRTAARRRSLRSLRGRGSQAPDGVRADGGEAVGAPSFKRDSGGTEAGARVDRKRPGEAGSVRRGGGTAGVLGQGAWPVSRETGETAEAPSWDGVSSVSTLRAEDGARALSRAVQRDARRYDGGFTIY